MKNIYRNYTPEEIFQMLQEEHRLSSFIDFEVEGDFEIKRDTSIRDLRGIMDYLPWKELYKANNEKYKICVPWPIWKKAVLPEKKKTVWDLCIFLSQHAKKEIIYPAKILGKECLSSAVFLTLKKNLSLRGIDVKGLKPSTLISKYFENKRSPYVFAEIILMGVRTFEKLKTRLRRDRSFWEKITVRNLFYVDTGSIKTFGDLSKKIALGLSKKNANGDTIQ